jgi:hypothetical protein
VKWAADLARIFISGNTAWIEQRVEHHGGGIDYAGTADLFFFDDDGELHVIDFKTFADGSFDHFPQLEGYALAIAQSYSYPYDNLVNLHVLCGGSFKGISRRVSIRHCLDTASRIFGLVKMSYTLPPKTNTHCKYCACCATCPAAIKEIETMTETKVDTVKCNIPAYRGEQIVKLLEQCTVAEAVIDKLRSALKDEIAKRGEVRANGIRYELRDENGTAKVKDADQLFGYLTANGVTTDDILASVKLGMPAASKLLRGADFTIKNDKEAREILTPFFDIPKVTKLKRIVE